MTDYTFTLNGTDFSGIVNGNDYNTSLIPVYGEKITTLDGVDHVRVLRHKGSVTVGINGLTDEQLETLSAALSNSPITVEYHCLQRNDDVTATMIPNEQTARFLQKVWFGGLNWNEVGAITLTEL